MGVKRNLQLKKHQGYYFPLFNRHGMRSSITPYLQGDLKLDQHHFALVPISELDMFRYSQSRNVVFHIDGMQYDLNGSRFDQQDDQILYEADLLFQKVNRRHDKYEMQVTSFVAKDENVELHEVVYKNISDQAQHIRATVAVPLYGRSADNIRDHRHVTSLLNRIYTHTQSVELKPTLLFNEKGHFKNDMAYAVIANAKALNVKGFIPTVEDYINEGTFEYPNGFDRLTGSNEQIDGYECMGAIQFEDTVVEPNESITIYFGIAITKDFNEKSYLKYLTKQGFMDALKEASDDFKAYVDQFEFYIENMETQSQLKWVSLQPLLRRYYGNSFLPHHDYGHGGKGWRDLWQDLLGMIMTGDGEVINMLYDNFAGVRVDGSNATIIGERPGEFIADRNSITRVWSDHGAWPLITVKMYIDETNDLDFLLRKQNYFFDQFTHYTHQKSDQMKANMTYKGTILEHLLVQNLVAYHHRGSHGYIKLEDADWNDGLDMAKDKGETIAFTHMYVNNLRELSRMINHLEAHEIDIFEEVMMLLDINCNLEKYFNKVQNFKGKVRQIKKVDLIDKLESLISPAIKFLQEDAFKYNRFEAYYDEKGELLDSPKSVNLTGQAMALMSKTATSKQAELLSRSTKVHLFEPHIGGYHLNNKYDSHMGRGFQFAYNHKENGAVFSHMAVMYAYGLYQYDLIDEGREAYMALLHRSQQRDSNVLLGIPEYFTEKGIGKYSYLTGSASWMLKLLRTEVFGLQFHFGELRLKPKLSKADFIDGKAYIKTYIFNELREVIYYNPKGLNYGQYYIKEIKVNGQPHKNQFYEVDGNIEVYLDEII